MAKSFFVWLKAEIHTKSIIVGGVIFFTQVTCRPHGAALTAFVRRGDNT